MDDPLLDNLREGSIGYRQEEGFILCHNQQNSSVYNHYKNDAFFTEENFDSDTETVQWEDEYLC